MPEDIRGKVVVVTGGATGIGRGAALEFAGLGAKVVVATGHNVQGGEDTVRAIRETGGEAVFVHCDVTDESQVKNLITSAVEKYGKIDCAFNNAGIGPDGVRIGFSSLAELDGEVWDKIMAVNAKGVFLCMKYEIKQMLRQGGGSIVNTASVGGLRMAPGFGAYGPSKAAVIAVTRTAALEYARDGIRVNVICPGPTLGTELMKNSMNSGSSAADGGEGGPPIPMGKMGEVKDVVRSVVWLSSDMAGHITGHALSVDGGMADIG